MERVNAPGRVAGERITSCSVISVRNNASGLLIACRLVLALDLANVLGRASATDVAEACECHGIDFFDFPRSEDRDVDSFAKGRKRLNVHRPLPSWGG